MPTDALRFGKKAQKISDISVPFYPALLPQKSSQHLRACAARVGPICSKNKKEIVLYHWDSSNTRNGSRLRSSSPITAPVVFFLSPVFFGYNPEKNTRFYARKAIFYSKNVFSITKTSETSKKAV